MTGRPLRDDNRAARRGVNRRSGKVPVRNQRTGRVLPCCWAECDRDGDNRYQLVINQLTGHMQPCLCAQCKLTQLRAQSLIYIFCGDNHRAAYVGSHRDVRP
jgi:hypothetical protein